MTTENIRALVRSRLEQADEALGAAQILLERGSLRTVVNRSYYAMFYAVLALLALHSRKPRNTPVLSASSTVNRY
jgi:uncharacterized protein (UPF0332 family)